MSEIHFENCGWKVTDYGIEQAADGNYHISAAKLGDAWSNGLPAWPQQMAEKDWVDDELFLQAFVFALTAHEGAYRRSFKLRWFRATVEQLAQMRAREATFQRALDTARPDYGATKFKIYTLSDFSAAKQVMNRGVDPVRVTR